MNYNKSTFERIEDYLLGKLSKREVVKFEQELAENVELREALAQHKLEHKFIRFAQKEKLKNKVAHWEGRRKIRNYLILLALIVGVVAFVLFQNSSMGEVAEKKPPLVQPQIDTIKANKEMEPLDSSTLFKRAPLQKDTSVKEEEVFVSNPKEEAGAETNHLALLASNYLPSENLNFELKSTSENGTFLQTLDSLFINENYSDLVSFILSVEDGNITESSYELAQEYLGHAYLSSNQFIKAAEVFRTIANNSQVTRKDRAEWYLTLSLLPSYREKGFEVDSLLNKMVTPSSYHNYRSSAIKLQEELR